MWALLMINRQKIKAGLSLFIWDTFLLIAVMFCITAITQRVMSSAIIIVGTIWVLATAGAIWHLGGVEVDSLFIARITGLEIGKEFTHALNVFFFMGCTAVVFFALFPVWKYWPSALILPVLLIGLFTSANLACKETCWEYFYKGYLALIIIAVISIVFFGITDMTQDGIAGNFPIQLKSIGGISNVGSWPWRMVGLGIALLVATTLIIKKEFKGKGMLTFIGSALLLIGVILATFPEAQAKVEELGKAPTAAKSARSSHNAPAPSFNTELPVGAICLIRTEPGQIAWLTRNATELPAPEIYIKILDTGEVRTQGEPWPANSKFWGLRNPSESRTEIYATPSVEGQGVSASLDKPSLNNQRLASTASGQQHLLPNVAN